MVSIIGIAMIYCLVSSETSAVPATNPYTLFIPARPQNLLPTTIAALAQNEQADDINCATLIPANDSIKYITKFEGYYDGGQQRQQRIKHFVLQLCNEIPSYSLSTESNVTTNNNIFSSCKQAAFDLISDACTDGQIVFTWTPSAPALVMPDDVSFAIGAAVGVPYILLQTQYKFPLRKTSAGISAGISADSAGVRLYYQTDPTTKLAGVLLLGSSGNRDIPPLTSSATLSVSCRYTGSKPIYPVAYRVHAHSLSRMIAGAVIPRAVNSQPKFILLSAPIKRGTVFGKNDPWLPQLFYPIQNSQLVINSGDIMAAQCNYNTTTKFQLTHIGSTPNDEMCNLYLMYYYDNNNNDGKNVPAASNNKKFRLLPRQCYDDGLRYADVLSRLPELQQIKNLLEYEQQAVLDSVFTPNGTYYSVDDALGNADNMMFWRPSRSLIRNTRASVPHEQEQQQLEAKISSILSAAIEQKPKVACSYTGTELNFSFPLGQVSGLAYSPHNHHLFILHRGSHVWDASTFDPFTNRYQPNQGPITTPPILEIDIAKNELVNAFGQNLLYMPHSITVDHEQNVWLTDVALHQMLKFSKENNFSQPVMILGEQFVPGSDERHFCKPTDVAVLPATGEFFVSDGYCNSRIVKFSPDGVYISQIGGEISQNSFDFLLNSQQRVDGAEPAPTEFMIPHGLALDTVANNLYVADRENGRIQVFRVNETTMPFAASIKPFYSSAVYAVDYRDGMLVAVSGNLGNSERRQQPIIGALMQTDGIVVGENHAKVKAQFGANLLRNPHAVVFGRTTSEIFVAEIGPNRVWHFTISNSNSGSDCIN